MPTNHRISSVMIKTSAVVRTTATLVDPCTGALGATSHRTSVAAVLPGHQSATGARGAGDPGLLPTGRPGPASLQCRPAHGRMKGTGDPKPPTVFDMRGRVGSNRGTQPPTANFSRVPRNLSQNGRKHDGFVSPSPAINLVLSGTPAVCVRRLCARCAIDHGIAS